MTDEEYNRLKKGDLIQLIDDPSLLSVNCFNKLCIVESIRAYDTRWSLSDKPIITKWVYVWVIGIDEDPYRLRRWVPDCFRFPEKQGNK